uniref:Uncharacterized protein n=1 Tax=Lates calcarifer TaxID=8187 RepID=A0A4W6BL10_LATCA
MAERRPKRIRSVEYGLKKKGYDQARGKCRVNIGEAFQRWRDLRELLGLKLDADVALFLLDRCATMFHTASRSISFCPICQCL